MAASLARALAVAVTLGLSLKAAYPSEAGLDYFTDAGPAIDALARGDLAEFLQTPAAMGPFSLLLRAPLVALVYEQREEVVYLVGALPCLAAAGALGLYLRRLMDRQGKPPSSALLVCALCVLNPLTFRALHWGHPEELLAAALAVAAVVIAARGSGWLAGLTLGLAVATKQWALIAVVPALLAAPAHRMRVGVAAALVAGALVLPAAVADRQGFVGATKAVALVTTDVSPPNVWWPFAAEHPKRPNSGYLYEGPAWVGRLAHPVIVLLAVPLALLYARRPRRPEDALLLLALLFLLRCLLDPINIDYYHAPFLLALLAYEGLTRRGLPYLAMIAAVCLALTFPPGVSSMYELSQQASEVAAVYLAWALPFAAYLGLSLYAPERLMRVNARVRALASGIRRPTAASTPG